MTVSQKIEKWLKETEKQLIENYNRMGLKASGNWTSNLESSFSETNGKITATFTGANYTGVLVEGRRKNNNQSKIKGFAYYASSKDGFIYKWCEQKGIDIKFAYPIALKIATEGIKVPNKYNSGGLIYNVINNQSIETLSKEIGQVIIEQSVIDFKNAFK